jgi:hypothetical protein
MKRVHIFTVGKHTANNGDVIPFSEKDLRAIADNYNPSLHEAPLVIGHPKNDDPAYGWVKAIAFEDNDLYIDPDRVQPEFAEWIAQGLYKKRSASFYPPGSPNNPTPGSYYLRHVGFLGAQPPAIKGLKEVEFSDQEDLITVEFSEEGGWSLRTIATALRSVREMVIEKFGRDEADKTVPTYQIDSLDDAGRREIDRSNKTESTAFSEPLDKENEMTKEELDREKKNLEKQKQKFADEQREFGEQQAAMDRASAVAFCEDLIKKGKLLAANKAFAVEFMCELSDETTIEFGEGDGKKTQSQLEAFKGFLSGMPKVIEFDEIASADLGDQDDQEDKLEFSEDLTSRV